MFGGGGKRGSGGGLGGGGGLHTYLSDVDFNTKPRSSVDKPIDQAQDKSIRHFVFHSSERTDI